MITEKIITKPAERPTTIRIIGLDPSCEYFKFKQFFKNRHMIRIKTLDDKQTGYYRFLKIQDQLELNKVAGWSQNKDLYRLEKPIVR